jgi:hypothetical protein
MTDARFPERWLNDRRILRLPDDAFRLFVTSLAWSVANRTDGRIYDDDLGLVPASPGGSGQLAKAGLWERVADCWQITVFEETQTSRNQLAAAANARRADREKHRRQRAHKAGNHAFCGNRPCTRVPGDSPGEVPGDNTRTGQARPVRQQPPTDLRTCLGCDRPPRAGCRTCWDHAYLEATA